MMIVTVTITSKMQMMELQINAVVFV